MNSTKNDFSGEGKTGIILFSRSRISEARSKKWHASHAKNLEIAQHLIERTTSVLESTGYDVILIDETKQRGHSFGEKINAAFEDSFQLGYDQLILIGNDSVGLTHQYISESNQFLDENAFVFGATVENGLYLIGFERAFFEAKSEEIANLPWRTNRLVKEFVLLAGFDGGAIIPVLSDLNTADDISRILKKGLDTFAHIIRTIIHGSSTVSERVICSFIPDVQFAQLQQRGPPSICFK